MIPFNKMSVVGNEEKYVLEALRSGKWCGRGPKTQALEQLAREKTGAKYAFFVTSGSSALEVSCLLAGLRPGDEVIMPSFGFVSAANAVVVLGAKPVFADIDSKTWNISAETVVPLITKRTVAIMPVHYAGSSAGIDELRRLCKERNIFLIEDAAQSFGATREGQPIGPTPWTTCFSLHETKNISAGEGGMVMTDSEDLAQRIEIIIEKGTDRQRFFRGQVDKYTWVDVGSSFIASDLLAAVGLAQLEKLEEITDRRLHLYSKIREGLSDFDLNWQEIPKNIRANGHIAGFVVEPTKRAAILTALEEKGVTALFHYVPLHDAPYSRQHGYAPAKDLPNTRRISEGLVRLPIYYSLSDGDVDQIVDATSAVLKKHL